MLLGWNYTAYFEGVFSQSVARTVLLYDLDKIIAKVPSVELLESSPENLLLSILSGENCTGPMDAFRSTRLYARIK